MAELIRLLTELDRLGPGSTESLRWALGIASVKPDARVLDAGCGTGADLGVLCAAAPEGQVTAIDIEPSFIDRVRVRYPKVDARVEDMTEVTGGPYDFIWSACAVYLAGIRKALTAWKGHLALGACVAFSDIRARVPDPPPEVISFWATRGIVLTDAAALEAEIAEVGYEVLDARWVGTAGWASYYGPLEAEMDDGKADLELTRSLRAEIDLWRTHGVTYGYRIVVVRPL